MALHIRQQNAGVIIRKHHDGTQFDFFEVKPPNAAIMSESGKLQCSFPSDSVIIPAASASSSAFTAQIASFLASMDREALAGSMAVTVKAQSTVQEVRDSANPHYILCLFTAFLRGIGQSAKPARIVTKRIADEVQWNDAYKPWSRSAIWLIIRVAIQTSLSSCTAYKHFMIYLHSDLLVKALKIRSFTSDLLFCMRAKVARRLYKCKETVPDFLIKFVDQVSDMTESLLQSRWQKVQDRVPKIVPLSLDSEGANCLSLPNSREFIRRRLEQIREDHTSSSFTPEEPSRLVGVTDFSQFANGALKSAVDRDGHIALFDFEAAVRQHLQEWTKQSRHSELACIQLYSCLLQYVSSAMSQYRHDVADKSMMILTSMDIWRAVDQMATSTYPVLLDYDLDLPESIIETLLLPKQEHLLQARGIQMYLRSRRQAGSQGYGSVFEEPFSSHSLSYRLFSQSPECEQLKKAIEIKAAEKKLQKIAELERLNEDHQALTQRAACLDHTCHLNHHRNRSHLSFFCQKCSLEQQANTMDIQVHEWPLPSDQLKAQCVAFELHCPEIIHVWRSTIYLMLCDLGKASQIPERPECTLDTYESLSEWMHRSSNARITLASSTKSFAHSHYASKKIPAAQSQVCLNNGLRYHLHDEQKFSKVSAPFQNLDFMAYGTFLIPRSSIYQHLQYALQGTSHTSNQVISDQAECPSDLGLHEHYAYGNLRSGPLLQWMNLVRELQEKNLTLRSEEVYMLCVQAAWQVGALSRCGGEWEWHTDLGSASYGLLLIEQATLALRAVQMSWNEAGCVKTLGSSQLLANCRKSNFH